VTNFPKIYVAGHRDMVGSAIVRQLLAQGQPAERIVSQTYAELDLCNQAAVNVFFEQEKPDQVYMTAAKVVGIHANNTYPAEFIRQSHSSGQCHPCGFSKLCQKTSFFGFQLHLPAHGEAAHARRCFVDGSLEPTNEPYVIAKIVVIKLCESYNHQYGASHGVNYRNVMPTNLYGSGYEKSARSMHRIEPSEVQVTTVHHVEGASLDQHEVEHVDLVHLSVADVDKRWDCAPQVQKRVQLESAFGFAKRSPIEQAQTQIDRGCVQRVKGVLQVESDQVRVAVELACTANQQYSDVRPNAPIARFVGIGQRRAMNAVTQSHRIKFARIDPKRYLDIAKTFAPRQLRKGHHAKLLGAGHATNARVAAVAIDDATKARPWHEPHNLRKKRLADIHERSPRG
jgi:hypothetical protein